MGYLGNRYLVCAAIENEFGEFNEDAGDFAELCPLEEGFTWSFGGPQMIDKPLMRADAANSRALASARRPELKMTVQARGGGYAAGHAQSAALCSDLEVLLSACLGTPRAGTGSGIVSATGPGTLAVSGAASMRAGEIVWVDPDGAGVTYPRAIVGMDGAELHLWPELPETPVTGGVVYAASNFTPFCGPVPSTLCFEKSSALWSAKRLVERICGMAGNVSLARMNARDLLLLKFELDGATDESEEVSAPRVSVSDEGATAWSASPAPISASGAVLYMGDAAPRRHSGFEYAPGAEIKRRDNMAAPSGCASHFVSAWAEKGVLHLPWSADIKSMYDEGASFPLLWACGDAANGMALYLPEAQIMEVERETVQGEEFMKIAFRAIRSDSLPERCLALSGRRS